MKIIISIGITFLFFTVSTVAQEFSEAIKNPFGINIDTSGRVAIYTSNFADLDNDGDIDIIYPFISDSFEFAWQENIGSKVNPVFTSLVKLNYQLTIGSGFLIPDFADMNNDGLVDIVSFGVQNDSTGFTCTYFENKGNNVFKSTPGEEIGLPGIGYAFGIPEIVDLNQDGDKDLILSGSSLETFTDEADGLFYYGQNSNATNPNFTAWFVEPYSFAFMDTFQSVIVRTGDLDLDGDLDLLMNVGISDEETRFMYQENISPPLEKNDFSGAQNVSPFGLPENVSGIHFLEDLDGDGDLDLFVHNELDILYYENTSCVNTFAEIEVNLCDENSYVLNEQSYTASGIYTQLIANNNGCDSTITLRLIFKESTSAQFAESICEGGTYVWNNVVYDEAGDYSINLVNSHGCDSTITLMLAFKESTSAQFAESICEGGTYVWNNVSYNEAGNYTINLVNSVGCDSIVTLNLTITTSLESFFSDKFCAGETYLWNGISYNEEGMYSQSFVSASGCDSIVTLNLTITTTLESSFSDEFCAGETYLWNGVSYNEEGMYSQSFVSASGCDSIVELNLIQNNIEHEITITDGTLTVTTGQGMISWINCDTNAAIEGENMSTFTPNEDGNYAVMVEVGLCSVLSDCVNVMSSNVEDQNLLPIFKFYPNPAVDRLSIDTKGSDAKLNAATLTNVFGQSFTKQIVSRTINISDLAPGWYHISVETDDGFTNGSIVISR